MSIFLEKPIFLRIGKTLIDKEGTVFKIIAQAEIDGEHVPHHLKGKVFYLTDDNRWYLYDGRLFENKDYYTDIKEEVTEEKPLPEPGYYWLCHFSSKEIVEIIHDDRRVKMLKLGQSGEEIVFPSSFGKHRKLIPLNDNLRKEDLPPKSDEE